MKTNLLTSAELFIATGCSHCPIVLQTLNDDLKNGKLATLKTTNIEVDNVRANQLNIRSVPWFSFRNDNSFMIFSGNHSPKEIDQWLATAQTEKGMQDYIEKHLKTGQLATITQAIEIVPEIFSHVIAMINDESTSMDLRIGLDVLVENFAASEILQQYSEVLKSIVSSASMRLKIDALHYIALTGDINNKAFLQDKANDSNNQIKEAAIESLETLDELLLEH